MNQHNVLVGQTFEVGEGGGGRVRLRYGRVGLGWKQDKSRIRVGLSQGSNNEGFK